MKLNRKQRKELTRIAEYMISGGAYFWGGYGMFFVCDKLLGFNLWWAKLASNLFGWALNYALQRYWVFNNPSLKEHQTEVTSRYILITAVNFILDYGLIRSLKAVGITPYIGAFISAGAFTVWNYLWYKFWVFPEKMSGERVKLKAKRLAHQPHGHSAYRRA